MSYNGMGAYYAPDAAAAPFNNTIPMSGLGACCGSLGDLILTDNKVYWRVKDASETLSSIAVKVYGNVAVQKDIWNANPQGRAQASAKFGDQKWGWYNVGTLLELPKVSGYPDPMVAAEKAGLVKAKEGDTIVIDGETHTVGAGGKISKAGIGLVAGVAMLAVVGVAAFAIFSKKKGGGSSSDSAPASGVRQAAANRRRRRRRHWL